MKGHFEPALDDPLAAIEDTGVDPQPITYRGGR